jgi:hypothetical protein
MAFVEAQLENNVPLINTHAGERSIAFSLLDARFHFSDYAPFAKWLKKSNYPFSPDQAKDLMLKYYSDYSNKRGMS